MAARFIIVLLLVASVGMIGYTYYDLKTDSNEFSDPLVLIPSGAEVVVEIYPSHQPADYNEWVQAFVNSSPLVDNMSFNPLAALPSWIARLDSLYASNNGWRNILSHHPAVFANLSGLRSDQWMISLSLPVHIPDSEKKNLVTSLVGPGQFTMNDYQGTSVYENDRTGYVILDDCLLISPVSSVRQQVIIDHSKKNTLVRSQLFKTTHTSVSTDKPLHFYFNLGHNEWLALDPDQEKKSFTGFAALDKSSSHSFSLVSEPASTDVISLLPGSTRLVEILSYADPDKGWGKTEDYISRSDQQQSKYWSQAWKDLGDSCSCDLNSSVLSWRSGESGHAIIENADSSTSEVYFIGIKEGMDPEALMQPLISDSVRLDTIILYELKFPQVFSRNRIFATENESRYFIRIRNYIFIAETPEDLQPVLPGAISGARSSDLHAMFVNCPPSSYYSYQSELLNTQMPQSFMNCFGSAGSIMTGISYFKDNKYAVNVLFPGAIQHEQQQENIAQAAKGGSWEIILENDIAAGPWLVKNHNTGQKEILVQDIANNLYLISGEGTTVWKKILPEKIEGAPSQIDALKNGKLQYVFNSRNYLFAVDRKGNDLDGFPVKMATSATSELSVFDYDSDKNYRLVIAGEKGALYNYNVSGKITTGWKFKSIPENICSMKHVATGNEDRIVVTDEKGKSVALKRNGDIDKKFKIVEGPVCNMNSEPVPVISFDFNNDDQSDTLKFSGKILSLKMSEKIPA